jgi:hypothetical protein
MMTNYDNHRSQGLRRERLRALAWITYFVVLFVLLLCFAVLMFWHLPG